MRRSKILVVDDEEDILTLVKYNLAQESMDVFTAMSGEECLHSLERVMPDLFILDLMLPGLSGLDVCRKLKLDRKTQSIPVIMLTAKSAESDIVLGLELGADDYIVKPFSPKVLVARVKSVLRRSGVSESDESAVFHQKDFSVDEVSREVICEGETIELTYSEFEMLLMFIKKPGRVFTRQQIMNAVKGYDYISTERAIDVQIVNLRKKLKSAGSSIKTVRGVGYKFDE